MSVAVSEYEPTVDDVRREIQLQRLYERASTTTNRVLARCLWREFAETKAQRSPEMVAHLERLQGLR